MRYMYLVVNPCNYHAEIEAVNLSSKPKIYAFENPEQLLGWISTDTQHRKLNPLYKINYAAMKGRKHFEKCRVFYCATNIEERPLVDRLSQQCGCFVTCLYKTQITLKESTEYDEKKWKYKGLQYIYYMYRYLAINHKSTIIPSFQLLADFI